MTGTRKGGLKTAVKVKNVYGKNYYKHIGSLGGRVKSGTRGYGSYNVGKDGLTGRERAMRSGQLSAAKRWGKPIPKMLD